VKLYRTVDAQPQGIQPVTGATAIWTSRSAVIAVVPELNLRRLTITDSLASIIRATFPDTVVVTQHLVDVPDQALWRELQALRGPEALTQNTRKLCARHGLLTKYTNASRMPVAARS
jgi:hypothetical protein